MTNKPIVPEVLNSESDEEVLLRPIEECLTPKLKECLELISPEIRKLSLIELEDRLTITPTLSQIKLRFWKEYERTLQQNRKSINLQSILEGVCSKQYFFSYVVHREEMFTWLFHPPTGFDIATEEALNYGIPKIRRILDAPLFKQKADGSEGEFIPANAASILQAVKFLDARVKGSPLQRVEQKTLHAHAHVHKHEGVTRESLLEEMREIESRLMGNQQALQIQAPDETE